MSKLTKKDCIEALKELSRIRCIVQEEYDREEHAIIVLEHLINKHFELISKETYVLGMARKEKIINDLVSLYENCNILSNECVRETIDKTIKSIKHEFEEHIKLKEKYSKILDDCHDYRHETHAMKMTITNLMEHFGVTSIEELKNIYLNKP